MGKKNIYWKGFEELNEQSEIVKNLENNEFVEKLPVGNSEGDKNHNRRDFLKYAGFSTAAAAFFSSLSIKGFAKGKLLSVIIYLYYKI